MKVTSRIVNDDVVVLPWNVRVEVAKQNQANAALYTQKQLTLGNQLLNLVQASFKRSRVFRNYRDNFIAVKVEEPKVAPTRVLSKFCKDNGVTMHETSRGLIFRIKR